MNLREVKVLINLSENDSVWLIRIAVCMARFTVAVARSIRIFLPLLCEQRIPYSWCLAGEDWKLPSGHIVTRMPWSLMDSSTSIFQ